VKTFVDTNILVYAEDRDAGEKHRIARGLILDLWDTRGGALSLQVLQEFYVTVTRKVKKPMTASRALAAVEQYLGWEVVAPDGALLSAAIRLSMRHRLSFWDGLVVQAALVAGCGILLSEDLNHGQRFGPLRIVNPFRSNA